MYFKKCGSELNEGNQTETDRKSSKKKWAFPTGIGAAAVVVLLLFVFNVFGTGMIASASGQDTASPGALKSGPSNAGQMAQATELHASGGKASGSTSFDADAGPITLSGTLEKVLWEHPSLGTETAYVIKLDKPVTILITDVDGNRIALENQQEVQLFSAANVKYEGLDQYAGKHITAKGTARSEETLWQIRPVSLMDAEISIN